MTIPATNTNSNGEDLHNVDIHVITNDDGITIELSAIEPGRHDGPPTLGRSLLKLTSEPTGSCDVDAHFKSKDLGSLADWGFTQRVEGLILMLSHQAHLMVESIDG